MLLRMPEGMVRELVLYYVSESARGQGCDHLLGEIVSSVCEVPVTAATVYETARAHARCARIILPAQHVERFARIFPEARRLKDPAPGLAAIRLAAETARRTRDAAS